MNAVRTIIASLCFFLLLSGAGVSAPTAEAHHGEGWYRVTRVIDGDTVDVSVGRGTERVRLFGIQAPEVDTACGPPATAALRRLLTDNGRNFWVWLELAPRSGDRGGRALYYLWVQDGATWYLVDEWMAWFGYARAWRGEGQYAGRILAAELNAQRNRRGCMWS